MRGLDANVELHRTRHQTAGAEDTHDIERRQDRRDSFDQTEPAVPYLVPRALDDAEMQIDIRVRVRGTIGKAPLEPSRRQARIAGENRYSAIE
jgi:hypothetical protein